MRSGFAVRLLSGGIDCILGAVVALILSRSVGRYFAERAVVMLSIGTAGTCWRGPLPMILGIFGTFVYGLPFSLLLILLSEVLFGAGPGKSLMRIEVASAERAPLSAGRRLLRYTAKCAGLLGIVLALILGSSALAFASLVAAALMAAGFLLALGPGRRALHDRITGTAVYPVSDG